MNSFRKLKAKVGTDDTLARDGVWLTLDEAAGIRWRLKSVHTREAQRLQHEIQMRALESSIGNAGDYDVAVAGDLELIGHLVTEWEGMEADEGGTAPVSREAVAAALDAFPEWRTRVLGFVRNPRNYRQPSARAVETLEGKSARTSVPA